MARRHKGSIKGTVIPKQCPWEDCGGDIYTRYKHSPTQFKCLKCSRVGHYTLKAIISMEWVYRNEKT